MIGWFIRLLLIAAGFITSFFVERDALNFNTVQMIIATFLFVLLILVAACWPILKSWFKK